MKGTEHGTEAYISSLTGYRTRVYSGLNLLPTIDEAEAKYSNGLWAFDGTGTLTRIVSDGAATPGPAYGTTYHRLTANTAASQQPRMQLGAGARRPDADDPGRGRPPVSSPAPSSAPRSPAPSSSGTSGSTPRCRSSAPHRRQLRCHRHGLGPSPDAAGHRAGGGGLRRAHPPAVGGHDRQRARRRVDRHPRSPTWPGAPRTSRARPTHRRCRAPTPASTTTSATTSRRAPCTSTSTRSGSTTPSTPSSAWTTSRPAAWTVAERATWGLLKQAYDSWGDIHDAQVGDSEADWGDLAEGFEPLAGDWSITFETANKRLVLNPAGAPTYTAQVQSHFVPVVAGDSISAAFVAWATVPGVQLTLAVQFFTDDAPQYVLSIDGVSQDVHGAPQTMTTSPYRYELRNAVIPAGASYARVIVETRAHGDLQRLPQRGADRERPGPRHLLQRR